MSSEGLAATGGTAPAATGGTAPTWFASVQGEDLGHLQNRGWDKLDAPAAALAAVKAHREAEKNIGVPTDQLFRVPKDANDAEGWTRFNAKFGVPADAKDYDFSAVKFADGDPVDEAFANAIRPALQAARVSKDAAPGVIKAVVQYLEKSEGAEIAAKEAALATERTALKINWGANTEANLIVAKNAVAALGIKQEAVDALENQVGYAAVMEMFRNIGARMGEDSFITSRAPGGGNVVMTGEQAEATLVEKQNDGAFVARLMAGDAAAAKEFDNLTRMAAAHKSAKRGY